MAEQNGNYVFLKTLIAPIIIAAIVGGITVYGNSRVVDTKMETLCKTVDKLEVAADYLKAVIGELRIKDAQHDYQIENLQNRVNKREDR